MVTSLISVAYGEMEGREDRGKKAKRQEIAEGKILGACVTLCVYVWVCGYVGM